jgi:type VI protein secretion system component Hcp
MAQDPQNPAIWREHMNTDRVTKPTTKELGAAELEKVTGGAGKVATSSFSITKKSDSASPRLF